MARATLFFGSSRVRVQAQLVALDGSLLLKAVDESGSFWTYKHPTIGDAFANFIAGDPEKVQIYLSGARPESIMYEVVCAGASVAGASVVVPDSLHALLLSRIGGLPDYLIKTFLSYRANARFAAALIANRPEVIPSKARFWSPLSDDLDAGVVAALSSFGLLPDTLRERFSAQALDAVRDAGDPSLWKDERLMRVLTPEAQERAADLARAALAEPDDLVARVMEDWTSDDDPRSHFDQLVGDVRTLAGAVFADPVDRSEVVGEFEACIDAAVEELEGRYKEPTYSQSAIQTSPLASGNLADLFRDVAD